MSKHFNDSPIETLKDDRYGITPFAESIAKSIMNIAAPEGTAIALHGPWGSGKSSAVIRSPKASTAITRMNRSPVEFRSNNSWSHRPGP